MAEGALGRRVPTSWEHVEKYPLSALPETQQPSQVPAVIGVNWYSNFDSPVRESYGRYWIGRGNLGSVRGGHCVCVKSKARDSATWWDFYDQGYEGACVGFGCSRMMSLMNRKRYEARWLWDMAKQRDDWDDTNPGDDNGTSVRAALEVLLHNGHVSWKPRYEGLDYEERDRHAPVESEGISAFRWATSVDEVLTVLNIPLGFQLGAVPLYNSWGRAFPHVVWLPGEVLQRLIDEDGEVGLVTDR
jgi:hypothetical protein